MSGRPRRSQVDEDADALRVLIREGHEVLKDLKATIREAQQAREDLVAAAGVAVNTGIEVAVEEGLRRYGEAIKDAIDHATDAVYERFDVIAATLLGETETQKRKGEPSMDDYAKLMRRVMEGAHPEELTAQELDQVSAIADRQRRSGRLFG
jgi:hypothetical protein